LAIVSGGLNARKDEAVIQRRMPPYFGQEKGADEAPFEIFTAVGIG
jgi:hypothetical protein